MSEAALNELDAERVGGAGRKTIEREIGKQERSDERAN